MCLRGSHVLSRYPHHLIRTIQAQFLQSGSCLCSVIRSTKNSPRISLWSHEVCCELCVAGVVVDWVFSVVDVLVSVEVVSIETLSYSFTRTSSAGPGFFSLELCLLEYRCIGICRRYFHRNVVLFLYAEGLRGGSVFSMVLRLLECRCIGISRRDFYRNDVVFLLRAESCGGSRMISNNVVVEIDPLGVFMIGMWALVRTLLKMNGLVVFK